MEDTMDDLATVIGTRIKDVRERHGLTQAEFAKKISVTPSAVAQYERALRTPALDVIMRILSSFSLNADYLLGRSETTHLFEEGEGSALLDGYWSLYPRDRLLIMTMIKAMQESPEL